MHLGTIGQAAGMFVVTNVDDILVLALFFGSARRDRAAELRVVLGQYLGFGAILVVAVLGALGAGLLPEPVIPWLGLVPIALGLRAGWVAVRGTGDDTTVDVAPGALAVAAVTFAGGGDNIGVYVPVFAASGAGALVVFVGVFLVLAGVWCVLGRFFATRPVIAAALSRWGHLVLPVVLIGIGLTILILGGAFG